MVTHDNLGDTFGRWVVLSNDDGMVGSREPDWLQYTINVLVRLFRRYSMADSVAKSRTMTCQPGSLRAGILEEAMVLKCTGVRLVPGETLESDSMPGVWS